MFEKSFWSVSKQMMKCIKANNANKTVMIYATCFRGKARSMWITDIETVMSTYVEEKKTIKCKGLISTFANCL